ncbi:hypothetical protein BUALT_Bualt03G0216900 [Buddleja alternifolia]|uniref:VQ domain-containing protein n=1 Tax=Buddleja alternifolia TaxID=168488 RepID=A0AAV6Y296_9LAMI|nr:hypothetical protein BUALT_Bualt03G0216900 [Buddleja alternifolia]
MAISQTMSNPSDWMQFYQTNFSSINQTEAPPTTTTTAVATTTAAASRNNNNLSPDQGRVSKPIRRRSRASRRTPTTLLNTDTTNFRAMVQQFTGGPAAPFVARPQLPSGGTTFNFVQQIGPSGAGAAVTPGSGFHMQYHQNQLLQQQQMYMIDNMHAGGRGGGGGLSSHAPPGSSSSTNENRNYENYMI